MKRCPTVIYTLVLLAARGVVSFASDLPDEPVEIGTTPQFFVDDFIVDNRFAIKYKNYSVTRRFHQPKKHESNPLLTGAVGYVNVVRDEEAGLFRMWYQTHDWDETDAGRKTKYAIAYAESKDGLSWQLPKLGLFEWQGTKQNNVVWRGVNQARASGPQILLSLPEDQKRGYRFIMTYRVGGAGRDEDGIRLIGSNDGIHWDSNNDTLIKHLHSDTLNSIVFDARHQQYAMFCRAKHIYRTFKGDIIDTGASRRIARIANKDLWTTWDGDPQNVLIPDAKDAEQRFNFFYGMPTHYHAGIYWGFLWAFRMNDPVVTQFATSRDGIHWSRLPSRPALIPLGTDGSWDDGMTFGGPHWVEVGDQWWFYYAGWDDGHQSRNRTAGIGLATIRKERLISLHGPANGGGVVISRQILWPGGDLILNVDAPNGEVKVRISDAHRKIIPGFDYDDCQAFTGDNVSHRVQWKEHSIDSLRGKTLRLEIFLQDADLFAFRAESPKGNGKSP